jgi:hypothetical protein
VGLVGFWEIGSIAGLQHLHGFTKASDETIAVMEKAWISTLIRIYPEGMTRAVTQDLFWSENLNLPLNALRYSAKHGEQPTQIPAPRLGKDKPR